MSPARGGFYVRGILRQGSNHMEEEKKSEELGPTPEEMVKLRETHGERLNLFTYRELGQAIVAKPVNRAEAKRWEAQSSDPAKRPAAIENLVKALVVWPDADGLKQQFEDFPFIVTTWCGKILRAGGLGAVEDVEKKAL